MKRGPYAYRPGSSLVHRAPPLLKLFCLLAFSTTAFVFGLPASIGTAALVSGLALAAGIRPWELLRGFGPLLWLTALTVVSRSIRPVENGPGWGFDARGLAGGLIFAANLLESFAAGALFFAVTTQTELYRALDALERRLFRRRQPRFGLALALMLGFIPRFFEAWEAAEAAYRARAGKQGLSMLLVLAPLVTERMLETAAETAAALEARGA